MPESAMYRLGRALPVPSATRDMVELAEPDSRVKGIPMLIVNNPLTKAEREFARKML